MDRVIAKKRWTTKKVLTIAGIAALVILIAGSVYFTSGKSRLNVDTERVTIAEIKKRQFPGIYTGEWSRDADHYHLPGRD